MDNPGEFVCDFLSCLTHSKGKWTGKPFQLLPWESSAIMRFYGTIDERGKRTFQYLYLEIPKKNGKSELASGLGLYHLYADGELHGEVYVVAADKPNAGIIFNAALTMVNANRTLKRRSIIREAAKEIVDKVSGTVLKVLSAEAYSKHGYSPSCVIFDELHAQPNRDLWDVMTFGAGAAREQPVWIVLTTAGDDPDRKSIGWEVHEKAKTILRYRAGDTENTYDDPTWLPIIYGLPDDPDEAAKIDIYDEAVWKQCNPSVGVTIDLDTIQREALDAKQNPARERLFRWLRLNQWISVKASGWLPLTLFDAAVADVPDLTGETCYGGLDLSSTTDLSALVLFFPPQGKHPDSWIAVFYRAWIPEEKITEREHVDHVPFRRWVEQGFVSTCPGNTIDFGMITDAAVMAAALYDLKMLGVDPYLSRMITQELMEAGIPVAEIPQNMRTLSPAMKSLEKLLYEGKVHFAANPAARWCFGNVRCAVDVNENKKPIKNRSIDRIDIAVAWIIAAAAVLLLPGDLNDRIGSDDWSM
ncbi:MAG: terminase large subunit [Butyricicoccaceae bacterium]